MTRIRQGHTILAVLAAVLLVVSTGCAGKKKAISKTAREPAPLAAVKPPPPPTETAKEEGKPGLFTRLNPFRKKKETQEPAPQLTAVASAALPPETTKEEDKPGFFARLNPFRKRKAKPAEPEPSQPTQAGPRPEVKVKRKRGRFGRWFKRKPKALPETSAEDLQRRVALTAKGEVSPPPFEHNGLKLSIGETTKARIIATFGKPEHIFFSEGAEEILIYRRIRKIDSLYIFLSSQGLVKDYIITKEP